MSSIFLAGSSGLLGTYLFEYLRDRSYPVVKHGQRPVGGQCAFDLSDVDATHRNLDRLSPKVIVNLVAATNVDQCERDRQLAYQLNVKTVENLVHWIGSQDRKIPLIHLSTDQVYDGPGEKTESNVTLLNTYGWSKFCGEQVVLRVKGTCLRTNFFGRSLLTHRKSFSDWLVEAFRSGKPLSLFQDIFFSPLSFATLSEMLRRVIEHPEPGVFNLGSHDGLSKADFALLLAKTLGLSTSAAKLVNSETASLAAPRPKDMRMNSSLFEERYQVRLPTLREEIELVGESYEVLTRTIHQSEKDRNRSADLFHR